MSAVTMSGNPRSDQLVNLWPTGDAAVACRAPMCAAPGVAEVRVQALERQGSKVQMVADALEMLGEVWTVRRARTTRADGDVGSAPIPSLEAAASAADPPLGAVTTPAVAPPALQAG